MATEAVGMALSFATVFYLSLRRVNLSKVMFMATLIMAAFSGMDLAEASKTIWRAWIDPTTFQLAAAVFMIGVFSTVMKELGFLEASCDGLSMGLRNVKAGLMLVPALIGTMPVLGGAALSAPLVDRMGDSINMAPDKKAAVNLVFRHGLFFIFPFSPGLILASELTGFSIPTLVSRLWPMSLALWGAGYLVLLKKRAQEDFPRAESLLEGSIQVSSTTSAVPRSTAAPSMAVTPSCRSQNHSARPWRSRVSGFLIFAKSGSPLFLSLFLGLTLKWPLWLSLLAGTLFALLLAKFNRKNLPQPVDVLKGIGVGQTLAMFGIMSFKEFVTASPVFPALVDNAGAAGISPVLVAFLFPLLFGFGSASQAATIGVLLPILVPPLASASVRLYFTVLIYASSFVAYFFSPLHLCQVLTCQYFGIDIPKVYKINWPIALGLFSIIGGYCILLANLL